MERSDNSAGQSPRTIYKSSASKATQRERHKNLDEQKGRSIDNIAIERFFRTLKYGNIYINDYKSVSELREGVKNYIHKYNFKRFHSALNYQKPMMKRSGIPQALAEDTVYLGGMQKEVKNVA